MMRPSQVLRMLKAQDEETTPGALGELYRPARVKARRHRRVRLTVATTERNAKATPWKGT